MKVVDKPQAKEQQREDNLVINGIEIDRDTGLPVEVLREQLRQAEQSPTVNQSIEEILADVKAEGRRRANITS